MTLELDEGEQDGGAQPLSLQGTIDRADVEKILAEVGRAVAAPDDSGSGQSTIRQSKRPTCESIVPTLVKSLVDRGFLTNPDSFPTNIDPRYQRRPSEPLNHIGPNTTRLLTFNGSAENPMAITLCAGAAGHNQGVFSVEVSGAGQKPVTAIFKDGKVGDSVDERIGNAILKMSEPSSLEIPEQDNRFHPAPHFERNTSSNAFHAYCGYMLMRIFEMFPFLRDERSQNAGSRSDLRDINIPIQYNGHSFRINLTFREDIYHDESSHTCLIINVAPLDDSGVPPCTLEIPFHDYFLNNLCVEEWLCYAGRSDGIGWGQQTAREYAEEAYCNPPYTKRVEDRTRTFRMPGFEKLNQTSSLPQFQNVEATRMVDGLIHIGADGNKQSLFHEGCPKNVEQAGVNALQLVDRTLWSLSDVYSRANSRTS